jgi:diguanylate cyclase (GGDEF)-like protein
MWVTYAISVRVAGARPILKRGEGGDSVNMRRPRSIRVVSEPKQVDPPFESTGRPPAERLPILWVPMALRLMTLAWAGAIIAALLDEFGPVSHLPFLIAMVMTVMLVGATFLWTGRDDTRSLGERTRDQDAAEQDLLTNLPTYNYFQRRLADEFARSRRMGRQIAVVLIDVNNLTAVNKEYGVRAGDEVLRHVAKAADGTRRYNDIVARLGDDEFGVLLLDTGAEGVAAFIERLEERLARESAAADIGGRTVSLWAGVCSGSAVSSPEQTRSDAVLESAMSSLSAAKQDRERRRRMWLTA